MRESGSCGKAEAHGSLYSFIKYLWMILKEVSAELGKLKHTNLCISQTGAPWSQKA